MKLWLLMTALCLPLAVSAEPSNIPLHLDFERMLMNSGPGGRLTDEQRIGWAFKPPADSPEKQKFYRCALAHLTSCFNNNPDLYKGDPTLAYLLAKNGRWEEAIAMIEKQGGDAWHIGLVIEAADFCLSQKRPDMAQKLQKLLSADPKNVDALIELSKIALANGKRDEATGFARQAFYIESVQFNDPEKSRTYSESASINLLPVHPNVEGASKFWRTVDGIVRGGKFLTPNQVRDLVPEPRYVTGGGGHDGVIIDSGHATTDASSPILSATLTVASYGTYRPNGLVLEPNPTNCCLRKSDVEEYLRLRKMPFQSFRVPNSNSLEEQQSHQTVSAKLNRGTLVFTFDSHGMGRLKTVAIKFDKPGPSLMPPYEVFPSKIWKDHFANSQKELVSGNLEKSKKSLCEAFYVWDENSTPPQNSQRRKEYDAFKTAFCDLYAKMRKPDVKSFFEAVSYRQLRTEMISAHWMPERRPDFYTIDEFRNNHWQIIKDASNSWISFRFTELNDYRHATQGTPLYDYLSAQIAKASVSAEDGSRGFLGTPSRVELSIEPPPAKLLDDEDFENLMYAEDPKSIPRARPTQNGEISTLKRSSGSP